MDEKVYDLLEKLYIEVQEVKANMGTKAELQELGSELQEVKDAMATKAELQELRSELQEVKDTMATKAELQEIKNTMATKEDLELVVEELKTEIQSVYDEVKELRNDFNILEIVTTKSALDIAKLKAVR
ncbi:hypothetical protein [Tissierella sp.]|uniref:hypothetical protein n=1 Tax=Tissierella sp. TaxID=41274 RepID=UPI00307020C5